MDKWMFAVTSAVIMKLALSQEVPKLCKNKTGMLGGEELICYNATLALFKDPNLYLNPVHKLTCDNCTMHTIDGTTFNITKTSISVLLLTSSRIVAVKENAFSNFKMLRVLNLRNNSIIDLEPKAFSNLKRMAHFDLSHNQIRIVINNMFEELPNLNLLNLNHNWIYYIQPEAFKGLTNLRHLYLNDNRLERLEGFIFKYLPNLLLLYLENNNIIEMNSFAFTNLGSLNSLYLNNNKIRFLTQYNFKSLSNLVDLQLRGNNLTEIQVSSFNGLTNLKHLYLGNNSLKTVKRYGFVGLDNLQILDLIDNEFEVFDLGYIENMKKLSMLWLQQNHLSNLTVDFKLDPLKYLHSLGLNDNNLTVLNYKLMYEKLPNVRDIFIYNNMWKCELLVNMFNFLHEKNVSVCASVDCSVNKTKLFVEESCVSEEKDEKEDIDLDFISGGTCLSIGVLVMFINVHIFFV